MNDILLYAAIMSSSGSCKAQHVQYQSYVETYEDEVTRGHYFGKSRIGFVLDLFLSA
jgi:hypothetical protein